MRTLYETREGGVRGTVKVHNAHTETIQFPIYGMNGDRRIIEMDPGDEWEIDVGYAARAVHSDALGGKVLKYICPFLKLGEAPKNAPPKPEAGAVSNPAESPSAEQANAKRPSQASVDEVARLVAEHSKAELRDMAKELGLDARGSEQTLAEKIAAKLG